MAAKVRSGATGMLPKIPHTPSLLDPQHQIGLTALMSQVFGKPVEVKLKKLARPHQDADLQAQVATQKLKDRTLTSRNAVRDVAWGAPLISQNAVTKLRQERAARESKRKPVLLQSLTMGEASATKTSDILRDLNLSQVTSVSARAAGRLTKRISADQAVSKFARRGATTKHETHLLKGFQKTNITKGFRAGKRRIGSYGIRVQLGHT